MESVPSAIAAVLDVYSHNVTVTRHSQNVRGLLIDFCRRNAEMGIERTGPGRYTNKMKRLFAEPSRTRSEFRFHRNQMDQLLEFLSSRGVKRENLLIRQHEVFEPVRCEFDLKDKRPPLPSQVDSLTYVLQPPHPDYAPSKVVMLQPGGGKTYIALQSIAQVGVRTAIMIRPKYMAKWKQDILKAYTLEPGDFLEIKGSENLIALMHMVLEDRLTAKVIVFSNATFAFYLDAFQEQMGDEAKYPIPPGEFYERLGIGLRLIDEVHQDFHRNFRMDLYGHIPLTLSLSGTLDADRDFINSRYFIVWPAFTRPPEAEYKPVVEVYSLIYGLNRPHQIRCTGFAKMYNHAKFEESILRNKGMLQNYVAMIVDIVDRVYIVDRQPGQKMFVFCATVTMCTVVAQALASAFQEVSVERYVGDDDYDENLMTPDLVVSTLGSAGTAVDVPNLRETLLTVALDSKQGNIQALSRTRKLIDFPEVTPRFWFLSAREIGKHIEYAHKKAEKLRGKVVAFVTRETPYQI